MIRNTALALLLCACTLSTLYARHMHSALQQAKTANLSTITERDQARQQVTILQRLVSAREAEQQALIARIDAIHQDATTRVAQLESAYRENKPVADWGHTRLPAAVAGVLDYHPASPNPDQRLPERQPLPVAGHRTENQ